MESTKVFLDTSALLKRYVIEQGSHYVTQFFTPYKQRSIIHAGMLAQTQRLRAADAIQLASALRVATSVPDILLLTADLEMIVAAKAVGLQVENPNHYD